MECEHGQAAKFAQAKFHQRSGQNVATAVAKEVATTEVVRTSIAVDMADVARQMTRSSKTCAELQSLVTAQSGDEQKQPQQTLAMPTGKPLSVFDPLALPAAYTEFLCGDCMPFLKRDTPIICQQIFAALPSREELQYALKGDVEPYQASDRSRYDTPEFYAVFASFLRSLKLLQATKASFNRAGFEKNFITIA